MGKRRLIYQDLVDNEGIKKESWVVVYNSPKQDLVGFFFKAKNEKTIIIHGTALLHEEEGKTLKTGSFEVNPYLCHWYDIEGIEMDYVETVRV